MKYWALGHEIELDGVGEPFPTDGPLYEAVHRMNAAIALYLGHDPMSVVFRWGFGACWSGHHQPKTDRISNYRVDLSLGQVL